MWDLFNLFGALCLVPETRRFDTGLMLLVIFFYTAFALHQQQIGAILETRRKAHLLSDIKLPLGYYKYLKKCVVVGR